MGLEADNGCFCFGRNGKEGGSQARRPGEYISHPSCAHTLSFYITHVPFVTPLINTSPLFCFLLIAVLYISCHILHISFVNSKVPP